MDKIEEMVRKSIDNSKARDTRDETFQFTIVTLRVVTLRDPQTVFQSDQYWAIVGFPKLPYLQMYTLPKWFRWIYG